MYDFVDFIKSYQSNPGTVFQQQVHWPPFSMKNPKYTFSAASANRAFFSGRVHGTCLPASVLQLETVGQHGPYDATV